MTNTPLNPDALVDAVRAYQVARTEMHTNASYDRARHLLSRSISAYLAVAQPVVNSVEELDQLPMHSYVQGNDGFKHAKDWNGGWHLIVNRPSSAPHLSGSIDLPARVLYRPEVKP